MRPMTIRMKEAIFTKNCFSWKYKFPESSAHKIPAARFTVVMTDAAPKRYAKLIRALAAPMVTD